MPSKGGPVDFLDGDRAAMLALPPVARVVETVTSVRLGRDYYVRVAGNDYSVDPTPIGQLVDVHTTLGAVIVRLLIHKPAHSSWAKAGRNKIANKAETSSVS